MRKDISLISVMLLFAFVLVACSNDTDTPIETPDEESPKEMTLMETEKENEEAEAQKEVVTRFIEIVYYGEGEYDAYKNLYADSTKASSEDEFTEVRTNLNVADEFPEGTESAERLSRNLVAVSTGEGTADVYWTADPENDTQADAVVVWSLVDVNGEWKLE